MSARHLTRFLEEPFLLTLQETKRELVHPHDLAPIPRTLVELVKRRRCFPEAPSRQSLMGDAKGARVGWPITRL